MPCIRRDRLIDIDPKRRVAWARQLVRTGGQPPARLIASEDESRVVVVAGGYEVLDTSDGRRIDAWPPPEAIDVTRAPDGAIVVLDAELAVSRIDLISRRVDVVAPPDDAVVGALDASGDAVWLGRSGEVRVAAKTPLVFRPTLPKGANAHAIALAEDGKLVAILPVRGAEILPWETWDAAKGTRVGESESPPDWVREGATAQLGAGFSANVAQREVRIARAGSKDPIVTLWPLASAHAAVARAGDAWEILGDVAKARAVLRCNVRVPERRPSPCLDEALRRGAAADALGGRLRSRRRTSDEW